MASIVEINGAFHLRCYSSVDVHTGVPNALGEMGKPMRTQQSVKLVRKDTSLHKSKTSTAVLLLSNAKVSQIQQWESEISQGGERKPSGDMTVSSFYETVFLPQMELELAPATMDSYRRYWNAYLKDHFNHSKTLTSYEAFTATNFLESLATKYSKNTVKSARAVASAIFAYAVAKGYVTANPWRDARKNIKCQESKECVAYTAVEIEKILDALDRVHGREERSAQMASMLVTLCFYGGLRPSEAVGLRWNNVNLKDGEILISEVFVAGQFKATTKTEENRTVTMLPQLRDRMNRWHLIWGSPTDGLVFGNREGDKPTNINDISARIIGPTLKAIKLQWHGLYSCRRGFGTTLYNLGATVEEIAAAMGNSPTVVIQNYVKDKKATGARGINRWATAMGEATSNQHGSNA
jgi:integrase